jgi:peptidyl-prolyl cis-trans isomerase SurA
MLKKISMVIVLLISMTSNLISSSDVYISATVNDQIITNYDIKKEKIYLIILNPNLSKLNEKKVTKIATKSLINEVIKKKELEKYFNFEKKNPYLDKVFIDFYKRLNLKDEKEFKELLSNKKTYSLKEIKNKLKIEVFWNELIFKRYKNQVKIDESILNKKVDDKNNLTLNEYLLSEIFFKRNKDESLDIKISKIKSSIDEIGFNNTANIFSISESANFGGKIGWVAETNLSKLIAVELKKIVAGQYTSTIQVGNDFLILKIEEIRSKKQNVDKKTQLEEMRVFESNRQLRLFSNIYFNKVKINYSINEK